MGARQLLNLAHGALYERLGKDGRALLDQAMLEEDERAEHRQEEIGRLVAAFGAEVAES